MIIKELQLGIDGASLHGVRITLEIPDELAQRIHDAYERAAGTVGCKDEWSRKFSLAQAQRYLCETGPEVWHAIHVAQKRHKFAEV